MTAQHTEPVLLSRSMLHDSLLKKVSGTLQTEVVRARGNNEFSRGVFGGLHVERGCVV
jgi:hypothetical protein